MSSVYREKINCQWTIERLIGQSIKEVRSEKAGETSLRRLCNIIKAVFFNRCRRRFHHETVNLIIYWTADRANRISRTVAEVENNRKRSGHRIGIDQNDCEPCNRPIVRRKLSIFHFERPFMRSLIYETRLSFQQSIATSVHFNLSNFLSELYVLEM